MITCAAAVSSMAYAIASHSQNRKKILELCERLLNLQKIHRYSMHSGKGYIVSTKFTAALCNMLKAHLVGTRFTGALYDL